MKIRIKGNTVRFRLAKSEVQVLTEKGQLEETTEFATSIFTYAIEQSSRNNLSAELFNNKLTLYVPQAAVADWSGSDQVGIEYHMPLPTGNSLYLLLEKDFKCIDELNEDQSDFFENPHLTC